MQNAPMTWSLAIDRNRDALLAVVAALIGGREGGAFARGLRRAALALLRPAEAAARRLIVIAARGLTVVPGPKRPPVGAGLGRAGASGKPPAFPLFDRAKRFRPMLRRAAPPGVPRIRSFWGPPSAQPISPPSAKPPIPKPDPDAPVDAARLRLRLASLEIALADLPRQARRLARLRARRAAQNRPCRPLRLGRPPGYRQRPDREIDQVLRDCHALACDALRADTS
jgi:hypothetical protein